MGSPLEIHYNLKSGRDDFTLYLTIKSKIMWSRCLPYENLKRTDARSWALEFSGVYSATAFPQSFQLYLSKNTNTNY